MRISDWNSDVCFSDLCEGCGDCSRASNCLSVVPVETEFGRKRTVDLSTCNKDRSCLDGFCPSFVTVEGGRLRKPTPALAGGEAIPDPVPAIGGDKCSLVVTGIGGTGVVTIGAIIGMRSEENTSEIQSLMRNWYVVFCLKKKR